jgi:hypothetical protein
VLTRERRLLCYHLLAHALIIAGTNPAQGSSLL